MKIKDLGQVFTPKDIVKDILNASGYTGKSILKKHIMENSCGDGAFLIEIVKRYIKEYKIEFNTLNGVEKDLKKYIHGIEYDYEIYIKCIDNLNKLLDKNNIKNIKWDILCADTLEVTKYDNKMDFVVGNPPYVRVHNLKSQYENVRKYVFSNTGMTDLYIVFYEIGLKMLKNDGILCYITPNSFYTSVAGKKLRSYIKTNKNLELIMDLGHYQPFSVTTYTTICKLQKNKQYDKCNYYKYDLNTGRPKFIKEIVYENLFINNQIILDCNEIYQKIIDYKIDNNSKVVVKNGFATLNDKIFINKDFVFKENVINVIKASTGEWKKCIFPYDIDGNLIEFDKLDNEVKEYLKGKKEDLIKSKTKDSLWYAFGRSQALKDVNKNKLSINTTIKDIESIKLNKVKKGEGIYSGLYILTDISFDIIKTIIYTQDFINYLKVINKCKSGGYYTYSTKDLAKYINYKLEEENNE